MNCWDAIDDDRTLASAADTEQTLLAEYSVEIPGPCSFLNLPIGLRRKIYRLLCLSDYDQPSHARLWRPASIDQSPGKIGYFERQTVIPLLCTCRQIHDEAATVMYGENTFTFHISMLAEGPILFFSWLAPQYVERLRRVYIRTGFDVDTFGFRRSRATKEDRDEQLPDVRQAQAAKDIAASAWLVKNAWPSKFKVLVNTEDIIVHSNKERLNSQIFAIANHWPAGSFHMWKMVVEEDQDEFKPEFRRVGILKDSIRDVEDLVQASRIPVTMSFYYDIRHKL